MAKNKLNNKQLWALALTGIMTELNYDSHTKLDIGGGLFISKKKARQGLSQSWDINNREELLATLVKMEHDGHAARLEYLKAMALDIINSSSQEAEEKLGAFEESDFDGALRLRFLIANWKLYENQTIAAWDLGRNIHLCRRGYSIGYLTEAEAWKEIMYYAEKIQSLYTSWEAYGLDYFLGRVFWASGFGGEEEHFAETEKIYKKLIGEDGYWHGIKWNTTL
jgi:hypothetical protein